MGNTHYILFIEKKISQKRLIKFSHLKEKAYLCNPKQTITHD